MVKNFTAGGRVFPLGEKTYIMGILNVTPDSFSDGGRFNSKDAALRKVAEMIDEGADIIDIGGESTRPGHVRIGDDEEIQRVVPFIEAVKKEFDITVSLDTYKSEVARAGIEAGADIINDIWGFMYDDGEMARLCAGTGAACCLMHNSRGIVDLNAVDCVMSGLEKCVQTALDAGVAQDKIILDPGIGFAKTQPANLTLINRIESFRKLGYPVLLGASRKSVIGYATDLPVSEREECTAALSAVAAYKGVDFLRVHNVKFNKRAADMARALTREDR